MERTRNDPRHCIVLTLVTTIKEERKMHAQVSQRSNHCNLLRHRRECQWKNPIWVLHNNYTLFGGFQRHLSIVIGIHRCFSVVNRCSKVPKLCKRCRVRGRVRVKVNVSVVFRYSKVSTMCKGVPTLSPKSKDSAQRHVRLIIRWIHQPQLETVSQNPSGGIV